MVYTRFGSRIILIEWFDDESGEVKCLIETEGKPPRERIVHASQLKADGGLREIREAAKLIKPSHH